MRGKWNQAMRQQPLWGNRLGEGQPRARNTDPNTSQEAAGTVKSLRERQLAVLKFLMKYGPMTDADLVPNYSGFSISVPDVYPPQAQSGIRTRRNELVAEGYVTDVYETKLASGR